MCDPVTATLAAVSAAGTVGSVLEGQSATKAQNKARNAAYETFAGRVQPLQEQASTRSSETTAGFDKGVQESQYAAEGAKLSEALRQAITPAQSMNDLRAGEHQMVKDAYTQGLADAEEKAQQYAGTMGQMGAWSNNRFLNDVLIGRAGQDIGLLSNKAQGWELPFQAQLAAAETAGQGSRTMGGILSGIGTLAGIGAGLSAGGAFGSGGAAYPGAGTYGMNPSASTHWSAGGGWH